MSSEWAVCPGLLQWLELSERFMSVKRVLEIVMGCESMLSGLVTASFRPESRLPQIHL